MIHSIVALELLRLLDLFAHETYEVYELADSMEPHAPMRL